MACHRQAFGKTGQRWSMGGKGQEKGGEWDEEGANQ